MLARRSPKYCAQYVIGTNFSVTSPQNSSTSSAAGSNRRARRAQNPGSDRRPVRSTSRNRCDVMRNPEIAKNTSTPTNPPRTDVGHR